MQLNTRYRAIYLRYKLKYTRSYINFNFFNKKVGRDFFQYAII